MDLILMSVILADTHLAKCVRSLLDRGTANTVRQPDRNGPALNAVKAKQRMRDDECLLDHVESAKDTAKIGLK